MDGTTTALRRKLSSQSLKCGNGEPSWIDGALRNVRNAVRVTLPSWSHSYRTELWGRMGAQLTASLQVATRATAAS